MGCSSSALGKAGDGSRFRSANSNECFSATEESESCTAQPKSCSGGRESAFCGNMQRGNLAPSEKPKASVMPTANGIRSCGSQPLAKDEAPAKGAGDQSGPTEKAQPPEGPEESEPRQPGGKDDTPGTEETVKDVDAVLEVQALKENAEAEPAGTAGARDSLGAGEGPENPQAQTMGLMKPVGTGETGAPLETAGELQCQEAAGEEEQPLLLDTAPKDSGSPPALEGHQWAETVAEQQLQEAMGKEEQAQPQLPETIPRENGPPEIPEGSRFVETAEEPQLQETLGRDAQPRPAQVIPKEDGTPERQHKSQPVLTPVMSDPVHTTPHDPGIPKQVQPDGIVGGKERPAGIAETAADVEVDRESPTAEEEPRAEGETGEQVETEMENEKVSEEAETKEEETGEAVDLSAAT